MPVLLTLRQSPDISRALILEARAARTGGLTARLRFRLALRRSSSVQESDVVARFDSGRA